MGRRRFTTPKQARLDIRTTDARKAALDVLQSRAKAGTTQEDLVFDAIAFKHRGFNKLVKTYERLERKRNAER